jgi:hypothetical protein
MFGYWSSRKRRDLSDARWIIDCLEIDHVIADPLARYSTSQIIHRAVLVAQLGNSREKLGFLTPDSVDLGSGFA